MRMARSTLAKYNLDMAQVETEGKTVEDEKRIFQNVEFYGRPWARNVAGSVAELCFCSYLFIRSSRAKDTRHVFVGRTSNAITASELAAYLVASITREAKRHQREHMLGNDAFRSFAWGASIAIARRVQQLRAAESNNESPDLTKDQSKALVVVQANEDQENKTLISKAFPKIKSIAGHGKGIASRDSLDAGREYGETVSLHRQVGADRKRLGRS
jgi:hypothetical protein